MANLVAGGSGGDFALARYNPDGSLDASFGGDGKVTTDFFDYDTAYALVVQPDGKLVAAGGSGGDFALARYNPDGSLDTSFDGDGKLTTHFVGGASAFSLAVQPDGKLAAAGFTDNGSTFDFALARYTTSGSGSFFYDPNGQFDWLAEGEVATDTFTYGFDGALTDTATVSITVIGINDIPFADAGLDQTAEEGQSVAFHGAYVDPDASLPNIEMAWDFGDGESLTGTLTSTHSYADNGLYTVTLIVTDDLGGVGIDTLLITVSNVAPALDPIADQSLVAGELLTLTTAFADPGTLDAHTAVIAWGDGFTETIPLLAGAQVIPLQHTYAAAGNYTATITLADDDGGVDGLTFQVNVSPAGFKTWLPVVLK
jgi:uncharacterized delta-60 repeat protein